MCADRYEFQRIALLRVGCGGRGCYAVKRVASPPEPKEGHLQPYVIQITTRPPMVGIPSIPMNSMLGPRIELLWFQDCPNHEAAEALLRARMAALGVDTAIVRVEVPDEETGSRVSFPGSPTIRVDGRDVEPGWTPCDECTPRCRLYQTAAGLRGLPEVSWIDAALRNASPG